MEQKVATSVIEVEGLSNLERNLHHEFSKSIDAKKTKSLWKKLSDSYFQLESFEKSGKLYEALGIKWFRKYCSNGGSYWTRRRESSMIKGRKKENLENFVRLTKRLEGIHVCGILPFLTMSTISLADKDYTGAGIMTILNLAINIYPIMSQRYNRNKTKQMLGRLEERGARKMPAHYKKDKF